MEAPSTSSVYCALKTERRMVQQFNSTDFFFLSQDRNINEMEAGWKSQ